MKLNRYAEVFNTRGVIAACLAGWALLFSASPALGWQEGDYGLDWVGSNTVKITNYTGGGGALTIPSQFGSNTVVRIDLWAFENHTGLTGVSIPDTIVQIQSYAFRNCANLQYVNFGTGVTRIGTEAFAHCTALTNLVIPDSVTTLGANSFRSCTNLVQVKLSDNLIQIGYEAFIWCYQLNQIHLPANLLDLDLSVVLGCTSLQNLDIPAKVTNITSLISIDNFTSFTVHPDNPFYSSPEGLLMKQQNKELVQCPPGLVGALHVPNEIQRIGHLAFQSCDKLQAITMWTNVQNIGEGAFLHCSGLSNITLGAGVTNIGSDAFDFCSSLTHIELPASLQSLGQGVFGFCDRLAAITMQADNAHFMDEDGILFNGSKTVLIRYPRARPGNEFTIPDGVTRIESYAFESCSPLLRITVPASVTSIGTRTFNYLGNIDFYDRTSRLLLFRGDAPVVDNPDTLFYDSNSVSVRRQPGALGWTSEWSGTQPQYWLADVPCYCSLSNDQVIVGAYLGTGGVVAIPGEINGIPVVRIDGYTFTNQVGITRLILPGSITHIGSAAFKGCTNLSVVYCQGDAPAIPNTQNTFEDCPLAIAYYRPYYSGWTNPWANLPTQLWNPVALPGSNFGIQSNRFGFTISGSLGQRVVVEAATDLAHPEWTPLQTNILTTGSATFSDPQWTNHPDRYYRFRLP